MEGWSDPILQDLEFASCLQGDITDLVISRNTG